MDINDDGQLEMMTDDLRKGSGSISRRRTKNKGNTHFTELVVVNNNNDELETVSSTTTRGRDDGGKRKRVKAVQGSKTDARLGARESSPKKDLRN